MEELIEAVGVPPWKWTWGKKEACGRWATTRRSMTFHSQVGVFPTRALDISLVQLYVCQ